MTMPTTPTQKNTWLAEHHRKAATYNGAELRPYEGRPGAMDAYALPSVINGVRTPRAHAHMHTHNQPSLKTPCTTPAH